MEAEGGVHERDDAEEEANQGHMLGLHALRRFDANELIAVYIGEDIGEQGGAGDVEMEARAAAKRGRHIMQ